jgi:hypothetical protein
VTKKEKQRFVRPEDALTFLHEALKYPLDSEERQTLLFGAQMAYGFGVVNERRFKARGDRRGRPKGTTRGGQKRHQENDANALQFMARIQADTGEARPYALARIAISKGHVLPVPTKEIAVRRLARRWKLLTAKK